MIITPLDYIGFYGPKILFASSAYLLWDQRPYLIMYVLGMILNILLNFFLKSIIKEARPQKQIEFLDDDSLKGVNEYGMPSGHAQTSFYSIAYLLCVKSYVRDCLLIFSLFFIGTLTLYQRIKFGRHTIKQVLVGVLVGSLFANVIYRVAKSSLK